MEVHLCHAYDLIDGSFVITTLFIASHCGAVHPSEVKGYHTDDGEPEEETVASFPCLDGGGGGVNNMITSRGASQRRNY